MRKYMTPARAMLIGGAVLAGSGASGSAMAQDPAGADPIAACGAEGPRAASIAFNRPVNGNLAEGPAIDQAEALRSFDRTFKTDGADAYVFQGRVGQQVDIRMQSRTFDSVILLRGPNGFGEHGGEGNNDDDCSGRECSENSRLTVTLPSDGTYFVYANSYPHAQPGSVKVTLGPSVSDVRGGAYTLVVQTSDRRPAPAGASGPRSCTDLINAGNLSPLDLARALVRRSTLTADTQTDASFADADRAVSILRGLGEQHPDELATALYQRASMYGVRNDPQHRLADLNEAIQLSPRDADAYSDRAWTYLGLNDVPRAAADANAALQIDADNGGAYFTRALAAMRTGDGHAAMGDLTQAVRLSPRNSMARVMLGWMTYAYDNSRYEEATRLYLEAVQINPRIPVEPVAARYLGAAFFAKGAAAYNAGNNDAAIEAYGYAIALMPNNAEAHHWLGNAYYRAGAYEAAIGAYDNALRLNPQHADAASNRGLAQQALAQQQAQQQQLQAQAAADARQEQAERAASNQALGRVDT